MGSDIYFSNPILAAVPTNRLLAADSYLSLNNNALPELTGLEIFDSRAGIEVLYGGFTSNADNVYFSVAGSGNIFINNVVNVFQPAAAIGLLPGDDIDALALDLAGNFIEFNGAIPLEDGITEALFSLAPGSPSLIGGGSSAADVFFTNFTGGFAIAGPANIAFPVNLTAENLGLDEMDNLDALDVIQTSTTLNIPLNPPIDEPTIPEPSVFSLFLLGLGAFLFRRTR